MDKMREEFESYWTARCNELGIECVLTRLINDEYFNHPAYYAWLGWKAAKALACALTRRAVTRSFVIGSTL